MDLTPDHVYRSCAEAAWDAPGTQRLWNGNQRDTYVELMLARPDWRAIVDVAYRAGWGDHSTLVYDDRAAYRAGREETDRERTPEGPFERGELLTAERVEAVMLAAAQDALVAIPDWTGGFRVPVSRWLTTLSETIEHGAAATDEHHGALALANLILRGPYRAGREDAAREVKIDVIRRAVRRICARIVASAPLLDVAVHGRP